MAMWCWGIGLSTRTLERESTGIHRDLERQRQDLHLVLVSSLHVSPQLSAFKLQTITNTFGVLMKMIGTKARIWVMRNETHGYATGNKLIQKKHQRETENTQHWVIRKTEDLPWTTLGFHCRGLERPWRNWTRSLWFCQQNGPQTKWADNGS